MKIPPIQTERKMETMKKKLIETINISNLLSDTEKGIFQEIRTIDNSATLEWLTEDISKQLDKDLYLQYSSDKCISAYMERMLKLQEDGTIQNALQEIAKNLLQRFTEKWNRLYLALVTSTYSPTENYNMEETETPDLTRTKNVKTSVKNENSIYGFNSPTPTPQNETVSSGEKVDNEETEKNTGTKTLTRHGNIGVTTNQQMINQEIDLRNNANFVNILFDDVDSIICLLVY